MLRAVSVVGDRLQVMDLKNDFSWSHSRDRLFRECARKYWFNYYGYWNGWARDADARTRDAYMLKKLTQRPMWVGSAVHEAIEDRLKKQKAGRPIADDAVEKRMLDQMRAFYRFSRDGGYRQRPKEGGFFEHEYRVEVTDDEWKQSAELAKRCLRTFLASPLRTRLDALPAHDFLSIDDLMSFQLDGVKINVALDLCLREGDGVTIYDWKTGQTDKGATADQLAVYALFAHETWGVSAEHVTLIEFNLNTGQNIQYGSAGIDFDGARGRIRASVAEMQGRLRRVETNEADEDRFELTDRPSNCARCQFQRICPGGTGAETSAA